MRRSILVFVLGTISLIACSQSFLERGVAAFNQEDYKQASRWFDWAIAADSTDPVCFANRAQAKRALGDNEGSRADFQKVVELLPTDGDAHFWLALAAFNTRDLETSVSENSLAILHHSSLEGQALLNRAQTYIQLGKNKEALQDYATVIERKDQHLMDAHFSRGQLYLRMNDKKTALIDFKKVVELNPTNIQLTWDIGALSYELEDYVEALSYYSKAIDRIEKPEPQTLMIRGETFEKLKNYSAAIEDYNRVIAMSPNMAEAHYSRGQAKARMGNAEAACIDWKKAAELGHQEAKGVIVYNCK